MNRTYVGVVVYVLLVLFAGILVTEYVTAFRDNSWIVEVEEFIQENNWDPDGEYIPLNDWSFFLYENGEEHYFELKSQMEFRSFLNILMNRINRQIKLSISDEELDEIVTNNKVLMIGHRFSTRYWAWTYNQFARNVDYNGIYFVLEDNLGKGLEGTIIAQETNSRNSVWQITKSKLW